MPIELAQRLTLLRQPRGRIVGPRDDAAGAQIRVPRKTLRAIAAKTRKASDHVIPRFDRGHIRADRLDDACALMAEHDRPVEREPPDAVDDVQVAMADAGGRRANQHLAPPRLVDLHRLDRQRLLDPAKDGGLDFHGSLPEILISGGALRLPLIASSRRIDRLH